MATTLPDCQLCGACCSFSQWWPGLKPHDQAERAAIPEAFIHTDGNRMRCVANRCSALNGIVGVFVTCLVYENRPHACRTFQPGGRSCLTVRKKLGVST